MDYDVIVGMDVGKWSDFVVAIPMGGDGLLFDGEVDQTEHDLRAMLSQATAAGRTLLVMDVWGGFGTLPALVAQSMGVDVAHMPSRSFAKAAESYGEDKTDSIDAYILADATRWRPQLVQLVGERVAASEEVRVLTAERADDVEERTRLYNRVHDLLQRLCPALEDLFAGERLHAKLALELLGRYGGPSGFRRSGEARCSRWASKLKYQRTAGPRKVAEVFEAISAQSVLPPGAEVMESQVRRLCKRIAELNAEIGEIEASIGERAADIPEASLLRTIPGVGAWTAAVIASQIGDVSRFRSESALAAYSGVAPKVRRSSRSVNSTKARRSGNKALKNAVMQSAQVAITRDGPERDYYDKKRAEGKRHRQALRALARRRVGLIYAMLSDGTLYEPTRRAA